MAGCRSPIMPSSYTLELPEIPRHWSEVLGRPCWRLEWKNRDGSTGRAFYDGGPYTVNVPPEWPVPFLAWPFWPEREGGPNEPGMFRPAGALYPFDVDKNSLRLTWGGGVDAFFYRALEEAAAAAAAASAAASATSPSGTVNPLRQPGFFDWPRFRAVMDSGAPPEIHADPWLVSWKTAAEKTIASSFRTSYIKAEERSVREITLPSGGPWIAASPFRPAEDWQAGECVQLALGITPEVWVCPGGMMVLSKDAQLWVQNGE